jgi:hypothetical protein
MAKKPVEIPDRTKGFVVTLSDDLRPDEANSVLAAIGLLKGVLDVMPIERTCDDHVVRMRVRSELGEKLWRVLYPETPAT